MKNHRRIHRQDAKVAKIRRELAQFDLLGFLGDEKDFPRGLGKHWPGR
jgi:hypothetical protein